MIIPSTVICIKLNRVGRISGMSIRWQRPARAEDKTRFVTAFSTDTLTQAGEGQIVRFVLGFVLGLLSGLVGMLAGWVGLAFLVIAVVGGPDREGGTAMGAFFNIGPVGGVIGFAVGVYLFVKFGLVTRPAAPAAASPAESASAPPAGAAVTPTARAISRPFAVILLVIVGGLAWAGWYEFMRSPYLTHGFMTLALQFKLPADMAAPADAKDVKILLDEGGRFWPGYLNENAWHGHQGSRFVILATVTMSYKASRRTITLSMQGAPDQVWTLDLPYDPDPTPGYTEWQPSSKASNAIEMNYRLTADR